MSDLARQINSQNAGVAKGIYKMPAFVPQFARGRDAIRPLGEVTGAGTSTSDSIPARISDGEAILNAGAVKAMKAHAGAGIIKNLNAMHAPPGAATTVKSGVMHAAGGFPAEEEDERQPRIPSLPSDTSIADAYATGVPKGFDIAVQGVKKAAEPVIDAATQGAQKVVDSAANAGRGIVGAVTGGSRALGNLVGNTLSSIKAPVIKDSLDIAGENAVAPVKLKPNVATEGSTATKVGAAPKTAASAGSTPTAYGGIVAPAAKNVLGEPVQALDEQGFYTVKGPTGATAKVLPWNATDPDALARTLPAEQYNALMVQNQSLRDQKEVSEPSESSGEQYDRHGNLISSQTSTGGFQGTPQPQKPRDTSAEVGLGYATLAQEAAQKELANNQEQQTTRVQQLRNARVAQILTDLTVGPGANATPEEITAWEAEDRKLLTTLGSLDPKLAADILKKRIASRETL